MLHLEGTVIKGSGRGKPMGIPTANIHVETGDIPESGVYVVGVRCSQGIFSGVMNVGLRPTFGEDLSEQVEVHILSEVDELYNERLSVKIFEKIRNEIAFDSIEALLKQIEQDILYAQQYFQHHPLS